MTRSKTPSSTPSVKSTSEPKRSTPWQMFPPGGVPPRRKPASSPMYAPMPQPPGPSPEQPSAEPSPDAFSDGDAGDRPAMSAPGLQSTGRGD